VNGAMTLSATATELKDLLLRAKNGEADACEELARDHRQATYVFALQLVGNPDDAKDLTQEAMLRFFSTLDRFQTDRPVRPWLFAIVRNLARDFWRRGKLRRHQSLDEGVPDLSRALADPAKNPEQSTLAAERQRWLWKALSSLPRAKREILVLRDFHDLAYAEIARVLEIPVGTVMSRLHAARKSLRQEFLALEAPAASRRSS
jgi:RNA polymerase sigma-70 factor (ECF subfamily)